MMMNLPPQVNTALQMLEASGYEAFLVGGAVRDYVRDGSPAKDWDITTNALAYNPKADVVDLVGGRADIEANIVRCVGDPDRRFQEDGLRMLRALRFASAYGMSSEKATAAAIHRNRNLLTNIAAERIQVESTKMLCGKGVAVILREFADVVAVPIPELEPTPLLGWSGWS